MDSPLHCIKPGGVAADAVAVISAETATLIPENEDDLNRWTLGLEPSDEDLEDDETVIEDN